MLDITKVNTSPSFQNIDGFILANESGKIGEKINVDVRATDDDKNDSLKFEITNDYAKYWLKLEPVTDDPRKVYVVTRRSLDRETVDRFDVNLKVSDSAYNIVCII